MEKRLINLKGFQPNRLVNDNIYDSKQFSLLRYSLFQNAYYNLPSHEVIQKSTCECRDTNLLRSQIWRFFFGPAPPPNRICPCNPPWKIYFFLFGPPPPPTEKFLGEKRGSICQGPQFVEYSSNQALTYIVVCNKQYAFCKKMKPETEIQVQEASDFGILEHMKLKSQWATDPNFLLSGSFGHPYGRVGDWLCIWVTRGQSRRVGIIM